MEIICFDLDGTLCTNTDGDYEKAQPINERIAIVNKLFEEGNTILIDTARGSTTGKEWAELTKNQLKDWGVKYHTLRVGIKLHADVFVDDKGINDKLFFNNRII